MKEREPKVVESNDFIRHMPETVVKDMVVELNNTLKNICYRLDVDYDESYICMFLLFDNAMKKEVDAIKEEYGKEDAQGLFETFCDTILGFVTLMYQIDDGLDTLVQNYKTTIDTLVTGREFEEDNKPDDGLSIPFKKESR